MGTTIISVLPKPCKTLKFTVPPCFATFLQTTDTLLMIMQADYTVTASRNCQRQLLAVATTVTQSAPTNFFPDGYAQIIERLNDIHFKSMFGFTVSEFDAIHHALHLPEPVRTSECDTIDSKTAMLMLLAWLQGSHLRALEGQFGWGHSHSSRIIHHLSAHIYCHWGHLLDVTSGRHCLMVPQCLDYLAVAIERKTGLPSFWGTIDGTIQPIAMPMVNQQAVYNRHKWLHALKYQFIAMPDGMLYVSKPFDG